MPRSPAALSQITKDFMEEVANEVVKKLDGKFHKVEGVPLSTVKYENGTFKKKTLIDGWEFSLAYAYVGTRGKIIWGLNPEDAQEYKFAEMESRQLDETFPLLGAEIAALYGIEGEKIGEIMDRLITRKVEEWEKTQELEKVAAENNYESNPVFGAF